MSDDNYVHEKLSNAVTAANDRAGGTPQQRAAKAFRHLSAIMDDDFPERLRPAFVRLRDAVFVTGLPEAERFPKTVLRMSDDGVEAVFRELRALHAAMPRA